MWKTPLVWKAEPGTALDSAFSAQIGTLITYHVELEPMATRPTLRSAIGAVVSNGSTSDYTSRWSKPCRHVSGIARAVAT